MITGEDITSKMMNRLLLATLSYFPHETKEVTRLINLRLASYDDADRLDLMQMLQHIHQRQVPLPEDVITTLNGLLIKIKSKKKD